MKLKRDYLTTSEILAVGSKTIERLLDYDGLGLNPGDKFFFKDAPGDVYVVQLLNSDGYTYENGMVEYGDVYPVFTTGMLIQIISHAHQFNLVTVGLEWNLIWDNEITFQSEEDELFVSFLWRSLAQIVSEGRYTW